MPNNTEHTRWDIEHRLVCEDCAANYHDAMLDMKHDAVLDAMEAEG